MNGRIEIEPPNKIMNRFYGFFKLRSELESELLSNLNFIPRGAKILTSWYFCFFSH